MERQRAAGADNSRDTVVSLEAHLEVFGFLPSPAVLEATPRGTLGRGLRAAFALIAGCTLAPLLIVLPPHFEPAALTVIVGVFFARKYWLGRFVLTRFAGDCPRCHRPLHLRAGTLLAFPHPVGCRHCHDTPHLALGLAHETAGGVITRGAVQSPEEALAADRAWRRRRRGLTPSSWSPASADWAPARPSAAGPADSDPA